MGILEIALYTAPVWAILCAIVASSKQRSAGGWAFAGLIFGLLALVVLVLSGTAQARPRAAALPRKPHRDPFK